MALVECSERGVQLRTVVRNLVDRLLPIGRDAPVDEVECFPKLGEHLPLPGLVRMEFEAERLESDGREAPVNNIEGGLLLGDEEHLAAERKVVCDQIGDRLRLAGTRGTVQHERLARCGIEDGRELGGVGAERRVEIAVVETGGDVLDWEDLDAVVIGPAALHEMGDERMRGELGCTGRQVLPHHKLAEGEVSERGGFLDRPAVAVRNSLTEAREDRVHVYPGGVLGKRIESVHDKPKRSAQELDERRVERGILVEPRHAVPLVHALARETHGEEKERRAAVLCIRALRPPLQEAERKVEGVDAAFLEFDLGETIEFLQASGEFVGRKVGERIEGNRLIGGEAVLQTPERIDAQRQNLLAVTRVEESVAEREVEQLLRPPRYAIGPAAHHSNLAKYLPRYLAMRVSSHGVTFQ